MRRISGTGHPAGRDVPGRRRSIRAKRAGRTTEPCHQAKPLDEWHDVPWPGASTRTSPRPRRPRVLRPGEGGAVIVPGLGLPASPFHRRRRLDGGGQCAEQRGHVDDVFAVMERLLA